jgi:hypothetical protein
MNTGEAELIQRRSHTIPPFQLTEKFVNWPSVIDYEGPRRVGPPLLTVKVMEPGKGIGVGLGAPMAAKSNTHGMIHKGFRILSPCRAGCEDAPTHEFCFCVHDPHAESKTTMPPRAVPKAEHLCRPPATSGRSRP